MRLAKKLNREDKVIEQGVREPTSFRAGYSQGSNRT
jgi:hypothetical protein